VESATEEAAAQVTTMLASRGWTVEADAPALTTLIETIATMRSLGQAHPTGLLGAYADAVEKFTALEVANVTANRRYPGPDRRKRHHRHHPRRNPDLIPPGAAASPHKLTMSTTRTNLILAS
jgi:hypothetical protein